MIDWTQTWERPPVRRKDERFRVEAEKAYSRLSFKSQKAAAVSAGLDASVLSRILNGYPGGPDALIKFARLVDEPVAKWLALANGEPWEELAEDGPGATARHEPAVQIDVGEVPPPIQAAIAAADTREEKVNVAFAYLKSLPNVRFGADTGSANADARLHIIRTYGRLTNVQVLPPEVV